LSGIGSEAFPDLHFTIEDIVAAEDKVAIRATVHCTHLGLFMGMPPTGKQAIWTGIDISRIAGGKIVELWAEYDYLGLMQQLGAIPSMGQAG
jgi:predicted ester cyclase